VTLEATCNPSSYTAASTEWSSSDEKIVTVDESGRVTAVGSGTATVTCTIDGMKVSCTVTSVGGLSVDVTEKSLKIGESFTVTATTDPAGTEVTFASSDNRIATVDEKGTVKAVSAGTVTIYARIGDLYTESISVTVAAQEKTKEDEGDDTKKSGCGSTVGIGGIAIGFAAMTVALAVTLKKRRN